MLISRGADVNELGEGGVSALTQAILANDVDMVKTLVSLGADVNQVDQHGETSLMHAATVDYGDSAVVGALLASGAKRDVISPDRRTALDLARQDGHADHMRKLE